MHRRPSPAIALLLLVLAACAPQPAVEPSAAVEPPPEETPRLILSLVVDQLRADYLTRFEPYFSAGLARLQAESVDFSLTYHDHAISSTAPGHATLATGAHPSRHGIVGNSWYDRALDESVEADEDWTFEPERAPTRMLATTLGDWIKAAYPSAKVYAASGKSRAAVTSAGHMADAAFWYDGETGRFVSSDYYPNGAPAWLETFNENALPDRLFGTPWEPLPQVAAAVEELGLEKVDLGIARGQLPRPVGPATTVPGESYYWAFIGQAPFADAFVGEFAAALIEQEDLGQDAWPDLLTVSFSSLDYLGHDFGPNSPEIADVLLRLDQIIGALLDRLDESVGLDNVLVVLSADHGVAEIPEYAGARRFWLEERTCVQRASQALDERFGSADWLEWDLVFDSDVLAGAGVALADAEAVLAEALEACPGIARVWTSAELSAAEIDDPDGQLYAHSFHPERSEDLQIQVERGAMKSTGETSHGTPYDYDRHVPWLLRLPAVMVGRVDEPVRTVDIAPTIAEILAVEPAADIDGRSRLDLATNAAPPSRNDVGD